MIELEKIGDRLYNKIGLDVVLEILRESWCDRLSLFLKCDRPVSHGVFAKAIATIIQENGASSPRP